MTTKHGIRGTTFDQYKFSPSSIKKPSAELNDVTASMSLKNPKQDLP